MGLFKPSCPYCGSDDVTRTNIAEKVGSMIVGSAARSLLSMITGISTRPMGRLPGEKEPTHYKCDCCHRTWKSGEEDFIRSGGKTRDEELLRQELQQQAEIRSKYKLEDVFPEMIKVEGNPNISSFYIGKYPVTRAQWAAVMGIDPEGRERQPVVCVSWHYCQSFIEKLHSMSGRKFRLPKEAEWEFAAHGGNMTHNYMYSGSNNIAEVAWYDCNSGGTPHPVGQKKPNELGIYDMSGNVWEWCEDLYSTSENRRIIRGGSWYNVESLCAIHTRRSNFPDSVPDYYGFRLAMDA